MAHVRVGPRGIRNHNPGNIRHQQGVRWQGAATLQPDTEFVCFESPQFGIRAICRVLITYQDKRRASDGSRIDSVQEIIERWAPPQENNTDAYARTVANALKVAVRQQSIDVYDYSTMRTLVLAIIKHENGTQPYTDDIIDHGLRLAGIQPPPKPLRESRTIKAGTVATASTLAAGIAEQAESARIALEPVLPMIDYAKYAFFGLTLVSVGVMMWARISDSVKEKRP